MSPEAQKLIVSKSLIATARWLLFPLIVTSNSANAQASSSESANVLWLRHQLGNKTYVYFDQGHGTQVSYLRADGTEFLWYPGNKIVLRGSWRIDGETGGVASICYQYGTNTYNPVTKQAGGRWECRSVPSAFSRKVDSSEGDVFALANRGSVPYILSRNRTTVAALKKRLSKQ